MKLTNDLWLFALAIAKVLLMTGLASGVILAIIFEKFGAGALRPEQSEPGLATARADGNAIFSAIGPVSLSRAASWWIWRGSSERTN